MILEDYVAVDLEMTGLNAKCDRILEIGAVRVRKKEVEAEYSALINPHMPLPPQVAELTHITDEMAAHGRRMDAVFGEFMEFCGESVLLGHNVIFDYSFLKQEAKNRRYPFERSGVDTLKIARKLLPAEEKKTLEALCAKFGIKQGHMHRALDDARAARELYEILEKEYEAGQPEVFRPYPLIYKAKKQSPATRKQKEHLMRLASYHGLTLQVPWETLTKSEASRKIDRIIAQYGRMPKTPDDSESRFSSENP